MAVSGIYEIVNLVNGKRYVGSAVNLARRKADHIRRLRKQDHHSRALQSAWIKYGEEAFQFRTIVVCDRESLILEEQKAIDCKSEYNMTRAAGSCLGRVLSDETKTKIADRRRGTKCPPRSEAHRQKLSEAQKGKMKSEAHMAALQNARRGYVLTDQDKLARAEGMRRAYANGLRNPSKDQNVRDKIAATLRERSNDPLIKDKLSKQASSYWASMTAEERKARCAHMRAGRQLAK